MRDHIIFETDSGRRLDKFLSHYLNKAPMPLIYKWLRKKRIKLNGMRASGSEKIDEGDIISFFLHDETLDGFMSQREIAKMPPVEVIYEDNTILIANKPAGLLTHSAEKNHSDNLAERVLFYLYENGSYEGKPGTAFTPAPCNRLDRNTSGIVVFGKTLHALQAVNAAIAAGETVKTYLAVAEGQINSNFFIEGDISKDKKNNKVKVAAPQKNMPSNAETLCEAICPGQNYSYVKVTISMGKPHQIRAHMASIGHPIAGDVKYGGRPIPYMPAQALHAHTLVLMGTTYAAKPPECFMACVKVLCNLL
jgi:23S rRNA pseudouridine955/2504/2580 synthase